MSPFEIVLRKKPTQPAEITQQKTGGKYLASYRYSWDRQAMVKEARYSLAKAHKRMKKYADKNRCPLEFKVSDKVLLNLTSQSWKKIDVQVRHRALVARHDGPFEVAEKVGEVAYRLKLPERMKIYPTFHVSFLKPYIEDPEDPDKHKINRAPPKMRTQLEKEIDKILDHWILGMHKKNMQIEFLIQWKGKPEADATWEKGASLWKHEQQIEDYLKSASTKMSSSTSGGGLLAPNIGT
ncbi:uncharacterized protein LOC142172156 [Nicotiana tabacum]|uniref:Uncharacterized protein LOC142172156 n=1 Tax=Nicotiana tabacum TaxID=4097 RepID=A0AC58T487_TOBAC